MANKKKKAGDGQLLGPVTHIKANASDTKALNNKAPSILTRQTQPSKNTVALSPMNHLRNETKTSTQMYSGKGNTKTRDVTKVRGQTTTQSTSSKGSKSSKSSKTKTKAGDGQKLGSVYHISGAKTDRDKRMMNAALSGKNTSAPSYMLSDKGKRKKEEADAAQTNNPMGRLQRHAYRTQTSTQDNYLQSEADAKLDSKTLSGLRKKSKEAGGTTKLSRFDKRWVSDDHQKDLQNMKELWESGQKMIDSGNVKQGKQMQKTAHDTAESIRDYYGYSGGASGSDFRTGEWADTERIDGSTMTAEGRQVLRAAKSAYNRAKKAGDTKAMQEAAKAGQDARNNAANYDPERVKAYRDSLGEKQPRQNTDAYGRSIYTPTRTQQEHDELWGTAFKEGILGGFQTLLDTAAKATHNAIQNRYDPAYQSRQFTARELQRKAEGRLSEREKQILEAQAARANKDKFEAYQNADGLIEKIKLGGVYEKAINDYVREHTPDDREKIRLAAEAAKMRAEAKEVKHDEGLNTENSVGMRRLQRANEATQALVDAAKTPVGKFATKAGLSMLQMAPFLAANVIPGAGQAISLGGMSALAAGQKAGELQADPKVSAQEALGRGLVSGGIEAFTEKISLDRLLNLIRKGGGTSFIKAVAKQAGVEASEESASYALNYLADKAAQDPKAKFSLKDLGESAAIGAVSGAAFGAGGHFMGDALANGTRSTRTTPTLDETTPSPTPDTETLPTQETAPRPTQEADTAPSDNPLVRATRAQEDMRTQAQEQAQANQETRNQLLSAMERLAQAQAEYRQRVQRWEAEHQETDQETQSDNDTALREEARREGIFERRNRLASEYQEYRKRLSDALKKVYNSSTMEERITAQSEVDSLKEDVDTIESDMRYAAGEELQYLLDSRKNQREPFIWEKTSADEKGVQLLAWQLRKDGFFKGRMVRGWRLDSVGYNEDSNVVHLVSGDGSRISFKLNGKNLSTEDIAYATADVIDADYERRLNQEMGRKYSGKRNSATQETNPVENQLQQQEEQPPAQLTEEQAPVQPMIQQPQQSNYNEIPDTFDEYKAQFQDDIDSREMTEGQLLDEYNALKRRNARIQNKQAAQPVQNDATPYNNPGLRDSVGSAREGFDPYSQAMNRYGTIEPGMNPSRMIDVPKRMNPYTKVSKYARTLAESESLPDALIENFERDVESGLYSYAPKKQKESLDRAVKTVKIKGWDGALEQWHEVVEGMRDCTDDDLVLAQVLLSTAAQAHDSGAVSNLSAQIAAKGTEAGRMVNALKLLKRTTPDGKLYYIQHVIDKLNSDYAKKGKDVDITLDPDLAELLLGSEDTESMDNALDQIYDDVAQQIPNTLTDYLDAWRYFAMLGNPRTHIRNAIGNVIFRGAMGTRNVVSAGLQKALIPKAQRTRTLTQSKEYMDFAKADLENVMDELSGNKYTDEIGAIRQHQLDNLYPKAIQAMMNVSTKGMEKADLAAKKFTYVRDMANFLKARGADLDNVPKRLLEDARNHAIEEARYSTFQQYSELAHALNVHEQNGIWGKLLIGGMVPFKRTPINIAKAAIDFSPVGLAKGIKSTVRDVHKGLYTASESIDKLASGLTGSGIMALGFFLARAGLVSASGDDDSKQSAFDKAQGSQNYALNVPWVNGKTYSYTIDWAAPAAIPLFMGAELFKGLSERDGEESAAEAALDAVGRLLDPLLAMTMMSGISSSIKSASYSNSNPIYGVAENVVSNYLGQFVPTALSQVAKTIDPVRRTTFTDANSKVPKALQQFLQRQGAKIPGVSEKMPEYLDVWGRNDVRSDNVLLRVLENFISPGYVAEKTSGTVEQELQRLNDAGYEGMLPGAVQKSAKLDGNRMTADQWMKRQKEQGSVSYDILNDFIGTKEYNALTDDQKAKFVEKAYEFAKNKGKAASGGDTSDFAKWYNAAENAQSKVGLSEEKFLSIYAYKSAIEDEAGDDAKASIKQGMWEDYVKGRSDLSQDQKDYVLDNVKFWQMIPADSGAYQKAKNAGYETPEEIQALLDAKKSMDTDGNGTYSSQELYEGIKKATSDTAQQEKMWNALKNANVDKTWSEVSKEQTALEPQRQKGEQALNTLSDDKKQAFASAGEQYNTNSYNGIYDTVMSVDATDAEREAYYNYINSKRPNPWKKSWAEAKAKVEKDRKKGK